MKYPKISDIKPLENKKILITFEDNSKKIYDCNTIAQTEEFRLLQNESFFKNVRIDPGGYGISWNDDIDLSESEIWINGVSI